MFPTTTYRNIGAVVSVLRAVPWTITDFTVERYHERLYQLHLQIKREGGFMVREHHRLLRNAQTRALMTAMARAVTNPNP